jgi:Periplasmic lysozyme inhibitor of I-type lysozyme
MILIVGVNISSGEEMRYKKCQHGDFLVRVINGPDEPPDEGSYSIYIYKKVEMDGFTFENFITGKTVERRGSVYQCWMTNLDEDPTLEIIIATKSGSGAYGRLEGFKFNGTKLWQINVPNPQDMEGYMGHDKYNISGGKIYRSYPYYHPEDANCCPTGGERTLVYELKKNKWIVKSK